MVTRTVSYVGCARVFALACGLILPVELPLSALPPVQAGEPPNNWTLIELGTDAVSSDLTLHVRRGSQWRVEYAYRGMSKVCVAAGTGSNLTWQAGDVLVDGSHMAFLASIPLETVIEIERVARDRVTIDRHKKASGPSDGGKDDPLMEYDEKTGLPEVVVTPSARSTNYFWRVELSEEELATAFSSKAPILMTLLRDGRLYKHCRKEARTCIEKLVRRQTERGQGQNSRSEASP